MSYSVGTMTGSGTKGIAQLPSSIKSLLLLGPNWAGTTRRTEKHSVGAIIEEMYSSTGTTSMYKINGSDFPVTSGQAFIIEGADSFTIESISSNAIVRLFPASRDLTYVKVKAVLGSANLGYLLNGLDNISTNSGLSLSDLAYIKNYTSQMVPQVNSINSNSSSIASNTSSSASTLQELLNWHQGALAWGTVEALTTTEQQIGNANTSPYANRLGFTFTGASAGETDYVAISVQIAGTIYDFITYSTPQWAIPYPYGAMVRAYAGGVSSPTGKLVIIAWLDA